MSDDGQFDLDDYDQLFKSFWSPTFSYKVGSGFQKIGWDPNTEIEIWLIKFIIDHLMENGSLVIPNEEPNS